jgi:hypothetical protein
MRMHGFHHVFDVQRAPAIIHRENMKTYRSEFAPHITVIITPLMLAEAK